MCCYDYSNRPFKSRSASSCPMRCASSGVTAFCKTLYQMVSFYTAHLMESLFVATISSYAFFIGTSDGIFKKPPVPFWSGSWHIDGSFQRVCFLCGLFLSFTYSIERSRWWTGITLVCYPYLPLFLYQMPCFFGKTQHFLNALLTCHSRSIGNMGELIGIVA